MVNNTHNLQMITITSCINMLEKIGFKIHFQSGESGIKSMTTNRVYSPREIKVVNSYIFEGTPDPHKNTIVYAIESNNGERGVIIDTQQDDTISTFISQTESYRYRNN